MSEPHRHQVRVYFEDTDAGGVAYHATYLRWAERARTESLRAIGLPHSLMIERHDLMLVVQRIDVQYMRPARLDDLLTVTTAVREVRGASVVLEQVVWPEDEASPLAKLAVGLVCVKREGVRPAPIPEPWRGAFRAMIAPD